MLVRGVLCGLLIGLMIVALHGAIEGFQGGFAMDRSGGACAGTWEATLGSAVFSVMDWSLVTLAILIGSAVLGAVAGRTITHSGHPPREIGDTESVTGIR
jgi:hypothetical protein